MKKLFYLSLICPFLFAFSNGNKNSNKELLKDKVVDFHGLYWAKAEVTNLEYKEFLMGLIEENKAELVPLYAPDMKTWERDLSFNDPYTQFYFSHHAFDNYPVVGISHEAAVAYCEWKTRKFGDKVVFNKKNEDPKKVVFRLPSEDEWMAIARGKATNDSWIAGGYTYPRDSKGKFLFNHKLGEGDFAGYAGGDGRDYEGFMITAPVTSFPETSNGIFNIAGNVSEMVAEPGIAKGGSWRDLAADCSISSRDTIDGPNCWVGFRYVVEVQAGN